MVAARRDPEAQSGTPELVKLDEVDEENILLESTLLNAETPEHLKTQSRLTVIDQVRREAALTRRF